LTLYHSLFLPYLHYGILCWKAKCSNVFKLQKKAIRIVTGEKYNAHTDPLFKRLRLLKVCDIASIQELKFCFKLENGLLPDYFMTNIFIKNSSVHSRNTRSMNNLHVPRIKHEYARQCIQYTIAVAFNNCPILIKEKIYTHNLTSYIKYVKNHFLNGYSEICSDINCYVCHNSNNSNNT